MGARRSEGHPWPRDVTMAGVKITGLSSLTDAVGSRFNLYGTPAVPLPHPSGASSWLNVPANRERLAEALALVGSELRGRLR